MAGSGESAVGLISRHFPCNSGSCSQLFSERSLEVRHSAWDRDHACAGAQQRDGVAVGGVRGTERAERQPITPLFVALPAARAPAVIAPREARGYAISALRATSDQFLSNQVCGSVSGASAREAGEAGANPAHLTTARGDEVVESALCRREVSRWESDHERQFCRAVGETESRLAYIQKSRVRLLHCLPFVGVRERSSATGPPKAECEHRARGARANPSTPTIAG